MRRSRFIQSTAAFLAIGPVAARADQPVSVLYAGSLVTAFERSIGPAFSKQGFTFQGEAKGSVALANLIRSGLRQPDVFVSADPVVIDSLMGPKNKDFVSWYASFATTRLVIGYSPTSPFAAQFVDVSRNKASLPSLLVQPGLRIGRTDPALDPKGYRTLLALQLLEKDAGPDGLAAHVLGEPRNTAQILPEETLLARLESGDLDCAFLYATESLTRRLPAIELPVTANLGDPAQAKHYATASVTIDGKVHTGAPIVYALTVLNAAPNKAGGEAFVKFLFSEDGEKLLQDAGVKIVPPTIAGDPRAIPTSLQALLVAR